ncbi:MAG TPA: hypothetical protein VLT35_06515 [Methanocella sp.]|nr:hypothetical protein [Methanocella sp.]
MKINDPTTLLRISFWIGAIVDGFVGVQMLLPDFWAAFNRLTAHQDSPELSAALGIGASLMIGWTVLLLWADRRPAERKGVLLITVFPVVTGLFAYNLLGIASGLRTIGGTALALAFQVGVTLLFVYSYLQADKVPQKAKDGKREGFGAS